MSCSVIINTYNRSSYLRRLLASLAHLHKAEFEVIVVNGPSTDGTADLLHEYKGRVKVIDCLSRNLSKSRNLGLAAAAGDIVIFIDDDALPRNTEWLTHFAEIFNADLAARLGAIGGAVWHGDTTYTEFDGGVTSEYGLQIFHRGDARLGNNDQQWIAGVRGTNCSFLRQVITSIGGFDEFFSYYLDETDLCWRLQRAGFDIRYAHENGVRHYSAPADYRRNLYDRDWRTITRSDTYFALKNGGDPLPKRILKTLTSAPHKHFFIEINNLWREGHISFSRWIGFLLQWLTGLADGLWAGLNHPRKLHSFNSSPPPFLLFDALQPSQRLRIALLTQTIPGHSNNGGIGRYTFDLARGLHERGHEVHLICKSDNALHHESLNFFVHGLTAQNISPHSYDSSKPVLNKNLNYAVAVMRKLQELYMDGIEFDVVHASNWDAEALALIRAKVYPTVLMLVSPLAQVMQTEGWEPTTDLQTCIALDRWQIEHADAICLPAANVVDVYKRLMGVSSAALSCAQVTPLGITPSLKPRQVAQSRRQRLLFVGRLERRKGVHILLQLLPELLTRFPDWECHLVGSDTNKGQLQREFLTRHAQAIWLDRVFFHGHVSDDLLPDHYRSCDLFVAPSIYESFGLIYHEAMQWGKAVVGCRVGGVPEAVSDGVEGLLVSPGDVDGLYAALDRLMEDESLRCRLGEAGRQRIAQVSNHRVMATNLEKVYLDVIERVGAKRQSRRARFWPRLMPILDNAMTVFSDGWQMKEAAPSHYYHFGGVGATISFNAGTEAIIRIIALRHEWSGILEIVAGDVRSYVDLYKPGGLQLDYSVDIPLKGVPAQQIGVVIRVHSARHQASHAAQAWIQQIFVTTPGL